MSTRAWVPLSLLLLATFFRTLPLTDNRFHPDEALYASFGRLIVSGRDPLLAGVVVDKPPLTFYLTALSFALFGSHELAARLPAFYASLLTVAVVFGLARCLYGPTIAPLAALGLALSPFAILFSITVFIDPLLTLFGLWGVWLVLKGRFSAAGALFALALATKQTGFIFVPLALALGLTTLPAEATFAQVVKKLWRISYPLIIWSGVAVILIVAWDLARASWGASIGFWEQGYADNMPGRLVRANEVWLRALAWLDWLYYFTASSWLNSLFLIGLPLLLIADFARPSRTALADFILAGYLLFYLAAYWLLAFNVWDRYLVPLLPLFTLLLARVLLHLTDLLALSLSHLFPCSPAHRIARLTLSSLHLVTLASLCLLPAFNAAHSAYPVGGDHGAYEGIDDAARFIHTLPEGGVVYDHWLSWQWNFYLFDGPVYVAWFPAPAQLTTDLRAFGATSARYLVVPSWEGDQELRAATTQAGFEFSLLHTAYRRNGSEAFKIYQLVKP